MELYTRTSYQVAQLLTERYSTSFSLSSRLFDSSVRKHIYAIYGMVRIADEIVDTHKGPLAKKRLTEFEAAVYAAIKEGYSTNPILHAFSQTAVTHGIGKELIKPFFASMAMDIHKQTFSSREYRAYIYGSAEVIGLMCLKVFTAENAVLYDQLRSGACALGAAYQKINFLRDMKADYTELGRVYFPGIEFEVFNEQDKRTIINDIEADIRIAKKTIPHLPLSSRRAVAMSLRYYETLLEKLQQASVKEITTRRIRIPNGYKLLLLARAYR